MRTRIKSFIVGSLWYKACAHLWNPNKHAWGGLAFVTGWVNSSAQHPHGNLCQDESLLSPEALKETGLTNLDRGICCERHVTGQWVTFCPLPSPHRLAPCGLCIATHASRQKFHPRPWRAHWGGPCPWVPRASGSPLWVFSPTRAFCT